MPVKINLQRAMLQDSPLFFLLVMQTNVVAQKQREELLGQAKKE